MEARKKCHNIIQGWGKKTVNQVSIFNKISFKTELEIKTLLNKGKARKIAVR